MELRKPGKQARRRLLNAFDVDYYQAEWPFALTISPPDRTCRYLNLRDCYHNDISNYRILLKKCCNHYCLFPELDQNGRLHYHGLIKLTDRVKWFKLVKPALQTYGFICVKPLKSFIDHLNWSIYCLKEFAMTKQVLGKRNKDLDILCMPYGDNSVWGCHINLIDESPDMGLEEYFFIDPETDDSDLESDSEELAVTATRDCRKIKKMA